jgi:hypothetical protein
MNPYIYCSTPFSRLFEIFPASSKNVAVRKPINYTNNYKIVGTVLIVAKIKMPEAYLVMD